MSVHLIDGSPAEIATRVILDIADGETDPQIHATGGPGGPGALMDRCLNEVRGSILVYDPDFPFLHHWSSEVGRWIAYPDAALDLHILRYNSRTYGGAGKGGNLSITQITSTRHHNVREDMKKILRVDGFFRDADAALALGKFTIKLTPGVESPFMPAGHEHRCRIGIDAKGDYFPSLEIVAAVRRVICRPELEDEENEKLFTLLTEAIGYWITGNGPRAERGIILLGDRRGGNGKSWLLRLISSCLPPESVLGMAGRLQFGQSYENIALLGKRVLVANELDQMKGDDALKLLCSILSGDAMVGYRPQRGELPFTFLPKAGVIWSCNRLADLQNPSSGGFARRFVVFNCTNNLKNTVSETELKQAEAQIPGFICHCVAAAHSAMVRGALTPSPASSVALVNEWLLEGDPVGLWAFEELVPIPDAKTPTKLAYSHFCVWAEGMGYRQLPTLPRFSRGLRTHLTGTAKITRGNTGASIIKGMMFRSMVQPPKPTFTPGGKEVSEGNGDNDGFGSN